MKKIKTISLLTMGALLGLAGTVEASALSSLSAVTFVPAAASSFLVTNNATDTVENRVSALSWGRHTVTGLWVDAHGSFDWGKHLEAGGYSTGYKGYFYGGSIGLDHAFYGTGLKVGLAFNYNKGKFDSDDDAVNFTDKLTTYGGQLYGSWRAAGAVNLVTSVGYFGQEDKLSASFGAKAKPKSDLLTASFRLETPFNAGKGLLVPYIGVRYLMAKTKSFSMNVSDLTTDNSMKDSHTFQVPIGFGFKEEYRYASGWSVTPKIAGEFLTQLGDRKKKLTVASFEQSESANSQFIGRIGYRLMLAVKAEKNSWSLGARCGFTGGDKGRVGVAFGLNSVFKF